MLCQYLPYLYRTRTNIFLARICAGSKRSKCCEYRMLSMDVKNCKASKHEFFVCRVKNLKYLLRCLSSKNQTKIRNREFQQTSYIRCIIFFSTTMKKHTTNRQNTLLILLQIFTALWIDLNGLVFENITRKKKYCTVIMSVLTLALFCVFFQGKSNSYRKNTLKYVIGHHWYV